VLKHFEDHKEWRAAAPAGAVAIVDGYGAARFWGLFDMMTARNVPAFPVPYSTLSMAAVPGARVSVNPDPPEFPHEQGPLSQRFEPSGKVVVEDPGAGPEEARSGR
jgi:hypothetical protein